MLNLIRNENMKIYRRIRTWILVGLLIGLTVMISILSHNSSHPSKDWKADTRQSIEADQKQLSEGMQSKELKERLERNVKVNEYRLAHDIPPSDDSLWGNVKEMSGLISIITIFTVIIAADIVAGEFAGGTIKLLLIRPASRSKILLSKFLATILFSLFLLAVLFVTSFLLGGILYGFSDVGTPYVYAGKDLVAHQSPMIGHIMQTYGLNCISLIMVVSMAFMISTVFRSSSLAIGMSIMSMFVGQTVAFFLTRWSWGKYWLFANTDLTQYIEGQPLMKGMTMTFSIIVLIVYFIIFNALSWTIFKKRDVAA